jgi:hypothetical protein
VSRTVGGEPDTTVGIAAFLAADGFLTPEAQLEARGALEAAGLTRPGKSGMASDKLGRARMALEARLACHCQKTTCQAALAGDARRLVLVAAARCEICGGSNNQAAVREMVRSCIEHGVSHLLVVGGRPPLYSEILEHVAGSALEIRFVDGTQPAPNQRQALMDCAWAEIVVIWAPSPLPHKVSARYGRRLCVADRVEVHRRGAEALALAIARHLRRRPGERVARH